MALCLTGCALYGDPPAPQPDTVRVPVSASTEARIRATLKGSFASINNPEFLHMDAGKDKFGTVFVCGRVKDAQKSYGTAVPYMAMILSGGSIRPILIPRSETQNNTVFLSCFAKGLM